jgi:hypothetical protein
VAPEPEQNWAATFGLGPTTAGQYEEETSRFRKSTTDLKAPGGTDGGEEDEFLTVLKAMQSTGMNMDAKDVMQVSMTLQMLRNSNRETGEGSGHRAFRRMHKIRERPLKQPGKVVVEYIQEAKEKLGVEDGDIWQIYNLTKHYYWSLMPKPDPLERAQFGGTPEEFEAAAAYMEAMKKVAAYKQHNSGPGPAQNAAGENVKAEKKGKGKGKDDKDKDGENGGGH